LAVSYIRMKKITLLSALNRFTVLFEMGRSGSNSLCPPNKLLSRKA
jgi:hypothetical protein